MLQKQKCGDDNITTIKTSNESHIFWKKQIRKKFIKTRYTLEYTQIMKLIMKLIILV